MSSDLKPCPNPWCVSHRKWDVEIFEAHRPILIPSRGSCEWAVSCPVCPLQSPWSDTEAEAIAAWNARPDELERLSTPTDVADRREAIARAGYEAALSESGLRAGLPWDATAAGKARWLGFADAIISLIAGPLPEGFAEAREAWEGILAGMKRFGMESEAIETIDDYFASSKPTVRDRWQHVAYFDEGAFHWMSGIAPRDCELFARPTGES